MLRQTILWTALPVRRVDDRRDGQPGRRLVFSVVVSPRLRDTEGKALRRLGEYGDWVRWPDTLARVSFDLVVPATGLRLPARPVGGDSAPDADLWGALFPEDTPVRPYAELAPQVRVHTPELTAVHAAVRQLWGDAATLGDTGENEPWARRPATAVLRDHRTLRQLGALADVLGSADPDDPWPFEQVARELAGAEAGGVLPFATVALAHRSLGRHVPGPEIDWAEEIDFHAAVSLLSGHPELTRRLGLVLDLVVDVPERGMTGLHVGRGQRELRVEPSWSPVLATHDVTPMTAFVNDRAGFTVADRSTARAERGLLRLDDTTAFELRQVDLDGAALKLVNTAAVTGSANTSDTPESGVPALRSAGISVLEPDAAGALTAALATVARLHVAVDALPEAEGGPVLLPEVLHAEDVLAGYRLDVWDERTGRWTSTGEREVEYRLVAAAGAEPLRISGEGTVEAATTSRKPGDGHALLPQAVVTWEGWSLVAPRPGRSVAAPGTLPDGEVPTDVPNIALTEIGLEVSARARPGSLARLRFGRTYRFRVRTVDIAGTSRPVSAGGPDLEHVSPPLTYRRFEPIGPPVVALREPPVAGESAERVVVRSDPAGVAGRLPGPSVDEPAVSERFLLPPKVSQLLAEQHGLFDGAGRGMRSGEDGYRLGAREAQTLEDVPGSEPYPSAPGPVDAGSYLLLRAPAAVVPYLPDPLAAGLLLQDVPGASPEGLFLPFKGTWPDLAGVRLRVVASRDATPTATVDEERTPDGGSVLVATVHLPPATVAPIRISTVLAEDRLDDMGVWPWLDEAVRAKSAARAKQLRAGTLAGRNWLLMPYRWMTLVHAVQRPLAVPRLDDVGLFREAAGQTTAHLTWAHPALVGVHADSTAKVDVTASWEDPVDEGGRPPRLVAAGAPAGSTAIDPAPAGGAPLVRVQLLRRAEGEPLPVIPPPPPPPTRPPTPAAALRIEHGDTRHRVVRLSVTATSRFREYFLDAGPGGTPLPPEHLSVAWSQESKHDLHVPSSARPAAPVVRTVVPTFTWTRATVPGAGGPEYRSERRGSGLRVTVERPWWSSGAGEALGVVCAAPPTAPTDADLAAWEPYVSWWGTDPATHGRASGLLHRGLFAPGQSISPRTWPSRPGETAPGAPAEVGVWAAPPTFDERADAWSVDVPLDLAAAGHGTSFVRLVVVRHQPHSLNGQHLSTPVTCDPVQLAETYRLTVAASADGWSVRLVHGSAEAARGVPASELTAQVRLQSRLWPGDDLGWRDVPAAGTATLSPDAGGWRGEIAAPATSWVGRALVTVQETRPAAQPGEPPRHRAVYLETVPLPLAVDTA